jgi:DNA-binding CsgD family transcriptional regulator/predicted negative regulator of RcsB-dependent stress response
MTGLVLPCDLASLKETWRSCQAVPNIIPVKEELEALVTAGDRALEAGEWSAARDSFRTALELGQTAEALNGLGQALWWLGKTQDSIDYRERAYAEFRRRPDPVQAATIALVLCVHYQANVGNPAASAGWLARATRLVEEFELEDFRGWLLLMKAAEAEDPATGEKLARETKEFAGQTRDLDLELCALAQIGSCLIKQGKVDEGLILLDEAMAGSLGGEGGNFDTVVFTSCEMIGSCARCAEFERAVQWIRAADRFTERYGCPFLYVYCRTLYGSVLVATGDWSRAEIELNTALKESRGSQPALHSSAAAMLAELRVAQARIEEAERLVAGFEDQQSAAAAVAAIHLARENPVLAESTIRRALEMVGKNELERALLIELLGEAEIAQGRSEVAADSGRDLAELGTARNCQVMVARGERLWGRAVAKGGKESGARVHLEAALAVFVRLGMPFEAARTHLMLADVLRALHPEMAVAEARTALAVFEDLGANGEADAAAALLRELGIKAARSGPRGLGTLTKREQEVLALLGEGLSNPEIAQRLYLSRKTVEHHVAAILSKLGARNRAEAAAESVRRRALGSASE